MRTIKLQLILALSSVGRIKGANTIATATNAIRNISNAADNNVLRYNATLSTENNSTTNSSLPDGVTICDGSGPVGVAAAYVLQQPIPYCMNYGKCATNYTQNPEQPCHCSSNYTGPHCEFVKGTEPTECTKHCFWGMCQLGAKSFELVFNTFQLTSELQYCLCPDNASGEYCERESQTCVDGTHCLNGGTCVTVETFVQGGQEEDKDATSTQAYCDCTTAYTGPDAFVGSNCQHKVTTVCSEEVDANGHSWCTNGGTCKGNDNDPSTTLGCDCPKGYSGPLCEFKDSETTYNECTLSCNNGGICRKGAKDVSFLKSFGLDRHLVVDRFDQNFEHCVCPRGFVGLTCEYTMEVCPGQSTVCMHGGQCVLQHSDQSTQISCDCTDAETELYRYTGQYCEARSTSFCTVNGEKTPSGSGYDAFCTNGGMCKSLVEVGEPHPGCTCSGGYFGEHCEFSEPSKSNPTTYIVAALVGALGLLLVVLVLVLLYRRRRRQRLRRMRQAFAMSKGYCDAAPPPTMDHINQMEPWVNSKMNLYDVADKRAEDDTVGQYALPPIMAAEGQLVTTNASFHNAIVATNLKSDRSYTASVTATNVGSDYSAATNFSRAYSLT